MSTLLYNLYSPLYPSSPTRIRPHCISSLNQVPLIPIRSRRCYRRTLTMATESTQTPVIKQHKVIIPNKYGEKLVGLLLEAGSSEVVILCHGFLSNKENNTMVKLAAALEDERISSFRFDFAGNGESEGIFQYGNYWREAEDLRAVVEYFTSLNRVITAVVGHSKGGGVVLLYASKYRDVHTVVNVSGRYNLKAGIVERLGDDYLEKLEKDGFIDVKNRSGKVIYQVTKESMSDRLNTNMHEACLQIDRNCRVLTVHGSKDEIISKEDAIEFSKIIPNHELHIVAGANHGYSDHQKALASVVLSFIKKE